MKTDRSEEIQVLYEVSTAVGEGTDLDPMLAKSLSVLLRKLNCSAGAIYLISEDPAGRYRFQVRKSIPRNPERNPALVEAGRWLPPEMDPNSLSEWWQKLPLSGKAARNAHCHLLSLAPHGVLTMIRSGEGLSGDFLNSLRPITKKLAAAVSACLANAELKTTLADLELGRSALKRHKDHLERTVQERTEELRRLNAELTREIKERVYSEQALRRSEERYRKLVDSSPDGIIYHRDGIILFANPAAIQLFGAKSSEELLGTDLYDFVHEDFRDPLIQRRDKAVATGRVSKPMEARFVRMDGQEISLEVTGTLVPLEEGAVVQTIARDITDRKRAENALKESERRFRLVFQTSPDSINLNRLSDGMFIDINDGFSHLMGYSRDEVIGKTSLSLNIWKNAEDRQRLIEGLAENGYVENLEAQFLRKNGEVGVGLMSARILQINDEAFILSITRDITQRKQVEEALRRSGEQLALAIEGSGAGFWDWKVQTGELEINERWADIVGYTLDELSPVSIDTWTRLAHPDDLETSNRLLQEHFSEKRPVYECEVRMAHKDGHWVWVMDRGKVVEWDDDGKPVRMAGTHVDITERKQTALRAQTLTSLLEATIESTADGILVTDEKGEVIRFNRQFSKMWSIPQTLTDEKNHESALTFVREQLADPDAFLEQARELSVTPEKSSFDVLHFKDGRCVERYSQPQWIGDSVVGRVWSFREVTERKKAEADLRDSEEKFRTLVEQSPLGISLIGRDGRYKYVNPAFRNIFGYTLEDVPTGSEWFRKAYPKEEDRRTARTDWIEDLDHFGDGYERQRVYTVTCKDGSHKEIHFRQVTLENQDKFVIYEDITERAMAEKERKQLEDQLRYSQKMEAIGTLAAGVAHDLNNILSGLVSYPELLLLDLPEESPIRKPILTIKKSGEKAAAIVQDLLTLARRGVATTEPIQLSWIVNDYLKSPEFERLRSFHSNVQVETNLESDLPIITGSPFHLFKTVMNLVSNAVEAMPDGGTVSIETGTAPATPPGRGKDKTPSGKWVYLKVADTGVGIAREDQERIFDPFYTKKVMGRSGTGLGMAVVWGAVEDHRGHIDIESTKGRGTVFTLHFPAGRTPPSMDGALPAPEDYMGHGERIVVVDDIPEQRLIASKMLERLGYTVITMSSGKEAVDYVRRHPVDLFVLDMIMAPGIDGLETYRRILRIQPGQKAVIASGFSETKRVREAQHLGAGAYIKKPYSIEQIGRAVRRELERPSSSR